MSKHYCCFSNPRGREGKRGGKEEGKNIALVSVHSGSVASQPPKNSQWEPPSSNPPLLLLLPLPLPLAVAVVIWQTEVSAVPPLLYTQQQFSTKKRRGGGRRPPPALCLQETL